MLPRDACCGNDTQSNKVQKTSEQNESEKAVQDEQEVEITIGVNKDYRQ